MNDTTISVRPTAMDDLGGVMDIYPFAFPSEDISPLVEKLWWMPSGVTMFVCESFFEITGHIALTECRVDDQPHRVALLGPLAVHPDHQRQGLGTALIDCAIDQLKTEGFAAIYLLGDPAYYARHGFSQEISVKAPYDLPVEWVPAWQGISLADAKPDAGRLQVPAPWQDPALWTP